MSAVAGKHPGSGTSGKTSPVLKKNKIKGDGRRSLSDPLFSEFVFSPLGSFRQMDASNESD